MSGGRGDRITPVCWIGHAEAEHTLQRHAKTHSRNQCQIRGWDESFSTELIASFQECTCSPGKGLRRDNWVSVRYAEALNSTTSSVTLQSTDRHGILGQKPTDFPHSRWVATRRGLRKPVS